jgi:hypothetical protein
LPTARTIVDVGGQDSKGITLKNALKLVLAEHDLAYVIKYEVLLITTKDKASNELSTRVYPVADLVLPIRQSGNIGGFGGLGGGMGGMGGAGMGGGMGGMGAGMAAWGAVTAGREWRRHVQRA